MGQSGNPAVRNTGTAPAMNSRDRDMAAFALWILTMDQLEAAAISAATKPFAEDKPRVAVFLMGWWRAKS
jgi:hypothetical protein